MKKNSNVASFKNVKNILVLLFYLQQRVYQMMSALDKKRCIFLRSKKMYLLPQEGSFGKTFISESENHGLKSHVTFMGWGKCPLGYLQTIWGRCCCVHLSTGISRGRVCSPVLPATQWSKIINTHE